MSARKYMTTSVIFFLAALLMSAFRAEPNLRGIILAFAAGLFVGSAMISFGFGVASMASESMQRSIVTELLRNSPNLSGMHPTRSIPAIPEVSVFVGGVDKIVEQVVKERSKSDGK